MPEALHFFLLILVSILVVELLNHSVVVITVHGYQGLGCAIEVIGNAIGVMVGVGPVEVGVLAEVFHGVNQMYHTVLVGPCIL